MKFIHAADLHLDSPLRGLAAYPDAPAERLRTATREAFERLVSRSIAEAVDFMVIAGDVYDGDWKDFNTGLFFVRQMGLLRQAGIPVYLLHGNHDAESEMTRSLMLPDNVHVFPSRKAETFRIESLQVALHGRSFRTAATIDNLLPSYPPPVPGWLNIGVLHTALEGHAEHARYAPCSLAELRARAYQYWALGHVHEPWVERGEVTIAYPGNLQGRHIREAGARGALLVSAEDGAITAVERLEVDVLRWHSLAIDVEDATDLRAAASRAGRPLEALMLATPADLHLAIRVIFSGRSSAHVELIGHAQQLRQEVIAQALAIDPERIWIEQVRIETEPVPLSGPSQPGDDDRLATIGELERLARTAVDDPEFIRGLQADWQGFLERLPHEVLQAAPELAELRQDLAAGVQDGIDTATALLMARTGHGPRVAS